ncbi:MAG: hypothetical protein JWO09_2299 [Bacteroidetes bacterium]|nr:hypothetical protein [Bacteroidota bacterium]
MKHSLFIILFSVASCCSFSQSAAFEYTGRRSPAIIKEKLAKATFISEIMPEFGNRFMLPYKEQDQLNKLLQIVDAQQKKYTYPPAGIIRNRESYEEVMEYVSIGITGICGGKVLTSQGTGDKLSAKQKNLLNLVDPGTTISVRIRFRYKSWANLPPDEGSRIREGEYTVAVIPQTEAAYPGGFKQLTDHLLKNVFNKAPGPDAYRNIQQAVVAFTVNEEGKVINAKLTRSSADPRIDKLILDAVRSMPEWTPAKDAEGKKVKEQFSIPLGNDGC